MSYRLPEYRNHFNTMVGQSVISVDNGSISRISIPCFYDCHEDICDVRHHRTMHDHIGWPSPDSKDDSCQLSPTPYDKIISVNEINLKGEGYESVEFCTNDTPDGLSVQTMIDGNIIRLTINAMCEAAEHDDLDIQFSIYAIGKMDDNNMEQALLRDVVTKGILHICAGPIGRS